MHTNNLCRVCWKNIRPGVTICESCRDERIYYWAMVSTNKKRLKQKNIRERYYITTFIVAINLENTII